MTTKLSAEKSGMNPAGPSVIEEAGTVLHLEIKIPERNRAKFLEFCRRAFPVYESVGGTKMVLYEDPSRPGCFNEVAYYRTSGDYERSSGAVENDPVQAGLIKEWRSLMDEPPRVTVYCRRDAV